MNVHHTTELSDKKMSTTTTTHQKCFCRKPFLLATALIILVIILPLLKTPDSPLSSSPIMSTSDLLRSLEMLERCDIFSGKWVYNPAGRPYYTNKTCHRIVDQENCLKFGRPDTDFLKWKWKPEECKLPAFNPHHFLKLVRGKKMAFVGDSVGRNQMESLGCLLSSVAYAEDVSDKYSTNTDYFKRWYYADYKFTIATLWSPFLVQAKTADGDANIVHSGGRPLNLYLDQPDEAWATQIEDFDFVILSAGHWFFRPLKYHINGQVVGCYECGDDQEQQIATLTQYYGYKMAFRTAFKTLQSLNKFNGVTILRTFSPSHFENGKWNTGGECKRTRPFTSEKETKAEDFALEFYLTQVEELKRAQKEEAGEGKGLKFLLLASTEAMLMRPDGHPNHYGQSKNRSSWNGSAVADCVHWCLPGPVDTWNEFLLYLLRKEALKDFYLTKLQKN